eukprot:6297329-Prymnesium_polylepis.1
MPPLRQAWPGVSRRRTDAQLERPRPPPRHWRTASGALRAPGAADAPPPAAARRELCVHPPHWRDARRAAVAGASTTHAAASTPRAAHAAARPHAALQS